MFTYLGLFLTLLIVNQVIAQVAPDNPRLDQLPQYLRERAAIQQDNTTANSAVVTIDNWDNFSLGVDFAEGNIAEHPAHPAWYFAAYNTSETHHTENGIDWVKNNPSWGTTMSGDPVQCYDSIGNLFYENMYGSSILGCKTVTSTNNGATWTPSVTAIAGNDKNWLACDQTSGPYANYAYTTMTRSGGGNFARSMDHGATWTNTFAPTTQNLPGMMVCVGADGNVQGGAVFVVTNSGNSFSATYTFYKSTDGGATFVQKSVQQWANTVGSQVSGRNSVSNMRTRPYPMIAADNSYGANRGKLYCVYASNDPPGATGKSDVWCRSSSDGGTSWSSAVRVNDDPNTQNRQQWHPAIWCDKETGKLYAMWMDTRDCPTNDSALIYASYSTDGGATWVQNQQISNKKMKIDCASCGGGGTPRYEGDYNGIVSNKKGAMAAWTDFRSGTFQSMTGYFPDFAMAIDKASDTLYSPMDNTTFQVSIPGVKLYTDTVLLSGSIAPVPTSGTITFEFPQGTTITSYPGSKPVKLVLNGTVPNGNYMATFYATGPNGTPAHKRVATIKVLQGSVFMVMASATPTAICLSQTSQLNCNITGGTPPFNYSWSPAASLSNGSIQNPIATPTASTWYKVTINDNASHVTSDSVYVTVHTVPANPGPIAGEQTVCADDTKEYTIVEVANTTHYNWTVPAGAQILSGQDTSSTITVKWGNTGGDISVLVSNDCGQNVIPSILSVTVNTPPAAPAAISGPATVCINTSATFTSSYTGGDVNFNWTVPADATITTGQGTNSITVLWGANAGNVDLFVSNNCGSGPVVTKAIATNTLPAAAGIISGKDTVCMGHGNYVYSVPTITGATTYEWTLPQGATVSAGSGTNQITVTFSNSAVTGNLMVKGSNDCGYGTESSKPVKVNNCAGIGENGLNAVVKIYPNPAKDEVTVNINSNEKVLDLTLTDMNGKVVLTGDITLTGQETLKKLDVSRLAKGTYLLRLTSGERSYSEKLVIR
jgi:hypothetical protein